MKRNRMVFGLALALLMMALLPGLALADAPRSLVSRWRGEIEVLPTDGLIGDWTVDGQLVTVTADTVIDESNGAAIVGAQVQVLALSTEGTTPVAVFVHVIASEQRVRTTRMVGIVEELGNTPEGQRYMVVNQQRILLNAETTYENVEALAEGALVKVLVRIEDEVMTAMQVQVQVRQRRYVPINGTVEAIDETTGLWTIANDEGETRVVLVTDETELRGDPAVGDRVRGQALVEEDDSLTAVLIAVYEAPQPVEIHLEGPIQRFPANTTGRWVIAGQFVTVDDETLVTGAEPQVGALAIVEGLQYGNGTIKATSLDISETIEDLSFEATIVKLSRKPDLTGQWIVALADGSRRKVQVSTNTTLNGEMAVGALVQVTAQLHGRTTWAADEITVLAAPADEPVTPGEPEDPADEPGKPEKPAKPERPNTPRGPKDPK